jgi:serine/threonine protein kinase
LLGQVLDEYAERLARRERPSAEEYARRHPQLAAVLRLTLPALEAARPPAAADSTGPAAEILTNGPADELVTLGDFRIVRPVGRGGIGVVYEAVQISLNRRVALKVLPFAGPLDAKQLQRFKNEAQAAAGLHHTHIVPVYAVGCERGVHFYAMQFIDGQTLAQVIAALRAQGANAGNPAACAGPLSEAAAALLSAGQTRAARPDPDPQPTGPYTPPPGLATPAAETEPAARPSTEGSLRGRAYFQAVARLGIQAAKAMDHAHQMGVVHRDVKPGNLLVETASPLTAAGAGVGSEGLRLWVTDFGLAHCQSQADPTLTGDLVGTLRYMSPEQALAKRVVIDHRTDIYSLGATLYELLTLRPAFAGSDRQELLRQIAFEEPAAPRRTDRAIPAELETVVLKALAKNPTERYATAQELADYLRRFLNHEPVRARRPTAVQRLRKWCRRHQAAVTAAVVTAAGFVVLLAVAAAVSIWQVLRATEAEAAALAERDKALAEKRRADEQAAIAQEVNDFLQQDLLRHASSWEQADRQFVPEPNLTVKEALNRAAKRIGGRFRKRPLVEAAIRQAIGETYIGVGKAATAIRHLKYSLALRKATLGPDHPDTLASMHNLARAYRDAGQWRKALLLYEQALAKRSAKFGPDHPDTLLSMNSLANAYRGAGRLAKALPLLKHVLAKRKQKFGSDHRLTLVTMDDLALAYGTAGQLGKALAFNEQVLAKMKATLGADHPNALTSMHNLAVAYLHAGQWKALPLFEQTLTKMKETFGPDHPNTLHSMENLALTYLEVGQIGRAAALHTRVLAKRTTKLGPDHPDTLTSMDNLANAYRAAGQLRKALALYEQVVAKRQATLGPDHRDALASLHNQAIAYRDAGQRAKALGLRPGAGEAEGKARPRPPQHAEHHAHGG